MVLTGLKFVRWSLCITSRSSRSSPPDRLIGDCTKPEQLQGDMQGGIICSLHEHGVAELFRDVTA
ncbi:hypothetical protein [Salinibacter ruber]|uniref:hypothetical protein n=1 Tax=Salinibacter ruber TaxID=146919 RepID=UPI003C6DE0E8